MRVLHAILLAAFVCALGLAQDASAAITAGPTTSDRNGGTSGDAESSLTIPTPSPVTVGDVLVAQVTFEKGSEIVPQEVKPVPDPGAGWQAATPVLQTNLGSDIGQAIFYKVIGTTTPVQSSYKWEFRKDGSLLAVRATGGMIRYAGVDTSNPFLGQGGSSADSSTLTAPSVSAATSASMQVAFFGIAKSESTTLTTPTGMTSLFDRKHGNTSGPQVRAAQVTGVPAGSRTSTHGTTAGKWVAQQVALRPGKQNQTISFTAPSALKYGDSGVDLGATASSGLMVSYQSSTDGVCRIVGGKLETVAAGECTVTAKQDGDSNWNPAADVRRTFTIGARTLTGSFTAGNKVYDGTTSATITGRSVSGKVGSDDVNLSGGTATFADKNASSNKTVTGSNFTLVGAAKDNYTLNTVSNTTADITPRPVTVTADAKSKVYGASDPTLTHSVTSGSLVAGENLSGALARAAGENVGSYAINQGTLSAGSNYALTFVAANLAITERPITVTAAPKSKVYGDSDPALTHSVTSGSLVDGDSFSGSLAREAGEDVGKYEIKRGTLTAGTNYALTFEGADFTISPRAVTVRADAKSKVYGENDPGLSYSGSLLAGDSFSGSLSRVAGENVGKYAIEQGDLSAGSNYELTFVGADLTISPRAVTVTADPKSKVYGASDPSLTHSVTSGSLVNGDTLSGVLTRESDEGVGERAIQQGTLTAGTNYDLRFVGANLTITEKSLSLVNPQAHDKEYDGNATARVTASGLMGVVEGDTVSVDAILATFASKNVARESGPPVAQPVTVGEVNLAGPAAANYSVAKPKDLSATITPRAIVATAADQPKVYGETDPKLTYAVSGGELVEGDSFSGSLTREAGESVAGSPYAIRRGSLQLSANYDLSFVAGALSITRKGLAVREAQAKERAYDGTKDAEVDHDGLSGVEDGDEVSVEELVAEFASKNVARDGGGQVVAQPVTVSKVSLEGEDAGNYSVSAPEGLSAKITPRPVSVAADAQTKVYGEDDPALTYKLTSGDFVDGDTLSGEVERDAGEGVGEYAIKQGTLAATANYDLTFVAGSLSITKRAVTVTAADKSKVYGGSDPVLTYEVTGGSLVDLSHLTGALTRDAGEGVGEYALKQGTLAATANYDLTFVAGSLSITKKGLTVKDAQAQGKTYDGMKGAAVEHAGLEGVEDGDAVSVEELVAEFASKNVEREAGEVVAQAVTVSKVSLEGEDAGNYSVSAPEGLSAKITPRPVTVTADAQSKVYGAGDPALTHDAELLAGDPFEGGLSRAGGEDVGRYAIGQGTLDAGPNYALSFVGADLTITPRTITVRADDKSKVYGAADPALTHSVTSGSLVNGDTLSGALSRESGENVGDRAIQQGTLAATANYDMTFVEGELKITPRPITITADAKSKVEGKADPALTYNVTSGTLVDGDSFTGSLSRDAGEAVGSYPIRRNDLTAGGNYVLTYIGANLTITSAVWRPVGFHSPIGVANSIVTAPGAATPVPGTSTPWQTAKGGSTIPLKFNVYAGDVERTDVAAIKTFNATKLANCVGSVSDPVEELASAGSTSLRYDTIDRQFIQNWKAPTVSADTCYRVAVTFQENSAIHTFVRLRK